MALPKENVQEYEKDSDPSLQGRRLGFLQLESEKLKIRALEWVGADEKGIAITDDLVDRVNEAYDKIIKYDLRLCRARDKDKYILVQFYAVRHEILFSGKITYDNLKRPGSLRTRKTEKMDTENHGNKAELRPRWAEEARPKKQVKLRLEPNLIEEVDAAASEEGKTRNDWIEDSIRGKLAANKPKLK